MTYTTPTERQNAHYRRLADLMLAGTRYELPPSLSDEQMAIVDRAVEGLPRPQQEILNVLYGFRGAAHTSEYAARHFRVDREAVRGLERRALRELRRAEVRKDLIATLGEPRKD